MSEDQLSVDLTVRDIQMTGFFWIGRFFMNTMVRLARDLTVMTESDIRQSVMN